MYFDEIRHWFENIEMCNKINKKWNYVYMCYSPSLISRAVKFNTESKVLEQDHHLHPWVSGDVSDT